MDKNCGSCTYLDLSTGDIYGKYYCKKKYDRHLATDNVCYIDITFESLEKISRHKYDISLKIK